MHLFNEYLMDSKKRGFLKITSILVVLEAIFQYYVVGLLLVGYRPGYALAGFNTVGMNTVFTNPLKYFPALGYLLKTFFPYYWNFYHYNPDNPGGPLYNVFAPKPAEIFMLAFWIGLIVAAIITAIVYAIKLKGMLSVIPKTPLPTDENELFVNKKSTD